MSDLVPDTFGGLPDSQPSADCGGELPYILQAMVDAQADMGRRAFEAINEQMSLGAELDDFRLAQLEVALALRKLDARGRRVFVERLADAAERCAS